MQSARLPLKSILKNPCNAPNVPSSNRLQTRHNNPTNTVDFTSSATTPTNKSALFHRGQLDTPHPRKHSLPQIDTKLFYANHLERSAMSAALPLPSAHFSGNVHSTHGPRASYHSGKSSSHAGVGLYEAQHWHQRAYQQGSRDLQALQLGHAAAYEAYRVWKRHKNVSDPLGGDFSRQRDALAGLAMGEASRLLSNLGVMVEFSRSIAFQAAGATAAILFEHLLEPDGEDYHDQSRSLIRSYSPNAGDFDATGVHGRHRHRSSSVGRVASYLEQTPYHNDGAMYAPRNRASELHGVSWYAGHPNPLPTSYGPYGVSVVSGSSPDDLHAAGTPVLPDSHYRGRGRSRAATIQQPLQHHGQAPHVFYDKKGVWIAENVSYIPSQQFGHKPRHAKRRSRSRSKRRRGRSAEPRYRH